MIVISDTSPIGSLILIGKLQILHSVFESIVIPQKVYEEILVLETRFGHDLSEFRSAQWIEVKEIGNPDEVQRLRQLLDHGESEAIVLAKELNADFLLIDESEGRKIAQKEGLKIIGLIGVLIQAKNQKIINSVKSIMDELRDIAGFRISDSLYRTVLNQIGE